MHNYTSTSSWMAVAGAIVLISATYLAPKHQPTTLRPFTTEKVEARPLSPDRVQARLWQDPLEVGWKRINTPIPEDKIKKIKGGDVKKSRLWKEWENAPQTLQSQIFDDENDCEHDSVYYLPIVLSGAPYPESRERHLRSRFALQEAMEKMQYRPLTLVTCIISRYPCYPKKTLIITN